MPEEVNEVPPRRRAPWSMFAQYVDGRMREWKYKKDYHTSPANFGVNAYHYAKRHRLKCSAQRRGTTWYIRFWKEGDDGQKQEH